MIAVSALVVVVLLLGVGGWFYVNSLLNGVHRFKVAGISPETSGAPIDILLVGSDSRAFVTQPGQVAAFGSPQVQTGQRSDVIIVVRLVPKTRQVEMLSIPRDTYIPIPGTGGSNRINAAFNSGPSLLVKTIEQDFNIPINHVVVANFPGFAGMVNSLGGIYLDFPVPVRDQFTGLDISTTGCQLVNGTQALALVRSRHLYYYQHGQWNYDGMSDWSRIRRQQAFFHAVLNRANGSFYNLPRMFGFLHATAGDLQVDSGFSSHEMLSLGLRFRGLSTATLQTSVLPTYGGYENGSAVLFPAQPYAHQVLTSFLKAGATSTGGTTSTSPGHGGTTTTPTTAPATGTTVPASQVVFDNQKTLPEPWNPTPCSP